jgi:hypothetical protein
MLKRLLLKLASRGRPEALLKTIHNFEEHCSGEATAWIISLDDDDPTKGEFEKMSNGDTFSLPMTIRYGTSESKVHAMNRDIPDSDWDYVAMLADDCRTTTKDFDQRIREDFEKYAPDLDGVLWYPDNYQNRIPTHPVLGRKYYDRYGYVWNPAYKSIHCDDELRAVAKRQRKLHKSTMVNFVHEHYRARKRPHDALDSKNQKAIHQDMLTYSKRCREGFK